MNLKPVHRKECPQYPHRTSVSSAVKKVGVGALCVAAIVTSLGAVALGALTEEEPRRVAGGYFTPNLTNDNPPPPLIKPPEIELPAALPIVKPPELPTSAPVRIRLRLRTG